MHFVLCKFNYRQFLSLWRPAHNSKNGIGEKKNSDDEQICSCCSVSLRKKWNEFSVVPGNRLTIYELLKLVRIPFEIWRRIDNHLSQRILLKVNFKELVTWKWWQSVEEKKMASESQLSSEKKGKLKAQVNKLLNKNQSYTLQSPYTSYELITCHILGRKEQSCRLIFDRWRSEKTIVEDNVVAVIHFN